MALREQKDARFLQSVLSARRLHQGPGSRWQAGLHERRRPACHGGLRLQCHPRLPWPEFWEGTGNLDAREAIRAAREGRSSRFQGRPAPLRAIRATGTVQVSPILGPDGLPESILSVSRDITQLKAAEERTRLLLLELKHRMKNAFALVQGIANASFRAGGTPDEIKASLLGRLATLTQAQDLLTQTDWSRASIHQIVRGSLEPHQGFDAAGSTGRSSSCPRKARWDCRWPCMN